MLGALSERLEEKVRRRSIILFVAGLVSLIVSISLFSVVLIQTWSPVAD